MFIYVERVKHSWRMASSVNAGGLFNLDVQIWALHDLFARNAWGNFVDSVFGGQPCMWHGGRILSPHLHLRDFDTMKDRIMGHTVRGIGCFINFSALDAGRYLDDEVSNTILDILAESNHNGNHGVIVSDDALRDYVRNKYPELKITASILKVTNEHPDLTETPEYYDNLAESYDYVVLRQDWNARMSFLSKIKNKHKMEVLVNSRCAPNCTLQGLHLRTAINLSRQMGTEEDMENVFKIKSSCRQRQANNFPMWLPQHRVEWLQQAGFTRIKLEGRELDWYTWCDNNLPYLIKPSFLSTFLG